MSDTPQPTVVGPAADVLDRVRAAAAEVARRAEHVRIDAERVRPYAASLAAAGELARPTDDVLAGPWAVETSDPEAACGLVLALDAVNFGSGWHPVVRKLPGCSGAVTMATNLRAHLADHGPVTTRWLRGLTASDARAVFDQPRDDGPVDELMSLFAAALAELGAAVDGVGGGSFVTFVERADGSAARLVDTLRALPSFDDVATYQGFDVPLLKRAQLAVADLHRTFGGRGPGRFHDLDRLTAFADNLVPHVLRLDGVVVLADDLEARIDAGELLEPGSAEEVEIRAVGLHAVESLGGALAELGHAVPSWHLDAVLWSRGGRPRYKAHPRHRARSPYY